MKSNLSNNAEAFVPEKDVTETTEDGRTIQTAVKGVPIPMAEARSLGLVEGVEAEPSPAELHNEAIAKKRATAPVENKSATPSKSK